MDSSCLRYGYRAHDADHAAWCSRRRRCNIESPGIYKVTFSVSGTEPNQFALFRNGALVPGTIYGSGAGTQQNTGLAIIMVSANAVLTLRNNASPAAVTLATPIGGTAASTNAAVTIEKLA